MRKPKRIPLIMNISLIITIALLMHVNSSKAEEVDIIKPNQTFDYVVLLEGNTINVSTTQTTPSWPASRRAASTPGPWTNEAV